MSNTTYTTPDTNLLVPHELIRSCVSWFTYLEARVFKKEAMPKFLMFFFPLIITEQNNLTFPY